ncbi:unnamed protein product [Brassica rapa subsp. narinosa]
MASIKERDEIALSQNTIALKGFALAIQLVMVAAVPALTEVVQDSCSSSDSDSEDIDGSGRDIFTKKRTLNPAHARNSDKRTDVIVHSILVQDPERPIDEAILVRHDEVHDSRVDNLVEAIRRNYQFNNSCFLGGIRKIDVVHMREKVKSSAKCKRPKKGITTSSEAENSVIVDLVLDKIKPQIDVLESNIKIGSSRVDAIEGGVRKQVETLLGKFKGEMLSSLKDIVSEVCKDHLAAHNGPGNDQPSSPTNLIVPGCHTSHVADANAKTIENVLRDISQYSTPPRSNRICESVNTTPTKKQQVESGNVCGTPVIQSGAQSANSENRSRQQSFQQKLTPQNNKDNIADEPSFSRGLTQDEQIQEDIPIFGQTCPDHVQLSHMNVDDNIEGISSSRRSKRQKTVPSGLVEDYLCGPHLLSRAKESQRSIFAILDISELVRKFTNLESKMKSNLNPSDLGYTVMVKPTETVEDLETIIRERYKLKPETPMVLAYHLPEWMLEPEGTRTPPITLTTTPQVETMMQIRSWWSELKLCVSSGAENVAHYQFLSQNTFTISGATFVFKERASCKQGGP